MLVTIIDVGYALWFIFPAYCANAVPVIFGGGRPVDFGKIFLDGKPILGSHKTLRGFFSGLLVGTLVGFLQTLIFQHVLFQYDSVSIQCVAWIYDLARGVSRRFS